MSAPSPQPREPALEELTLAFLAGKRILLLTGGRRAERTRLLERLVTRLGADGALVLPVEAEAGMEIEDLVAAAAGAPFPRPRPADDFDALVADLESRLDLAGAGILAVDEAGLLEERVLADLIELSRAPTPQGRVLQVLLGGDRDLPERVAAAGAKGAAVAACRLDDGLPLAAAPRSARRRASPGRGRRRARLFAAAVLIGLAAGGAGLGLRALPPERLAPLLASLEQGGHAAAALALETGRGVAAALRAYVAESFDRPPPPAPPQAPPQVPPPAPPQATSPLALPLPPAPAEPAAVEPAPVPVAPTPVPAAPAPVPAAPEAPGKAAAALPDAGPEHRRAIESLLEHARRQIAAKRLTTPAGDNAAETLQTAGLLAPGQRDITDLTALMVATYRRWAAAARESGNVADARLYLQRALSLTPEDPDLQRQAAALRPR